MAREYLSPWLAVIPDARTRLYEARRVRAMCSKPNKVEFWSGQVAVCERAVTQEQERELEVQRKLDELKEQTNTQQVDFEVKLTLALPMCWSADQISTWFRRMIGDSFTDFLPGPVEGESPLNFTFEEEAEIYGLNDPS